MCEDMGLFRGKRSEKQMQQLAEARKHIKRGPLSEETKIKIGLANSDNFEALCDYCGASYKTKKSAYLRRKRHFCSRSCYAKYRAEELPAEEQNSYGKGILTAEERELRYKARTAFNH